MADSMLKWALKAAKGETMTPEQAEGMREIMETNDLITRTAQAAAAQDRLNKELAIIEKEQLDVGRPVYPQSTIVAPQSYALQPATPGGKGREMVMSNEEDVRRAMADQTALAQRAAFQMAKPKQSAPLTKRETAEEARFKKEMEEDRKKAAESTKVHISPEDEEDIYYGDSELASKDTAVQRFLDSMKPYGYRYKDGGDSPLPGSAPGKPSGRTIGIMAQDLEKTPEGKAMVTEDSAGRKQVAVVPMVSALAASAALLNEKQKALEAELQKGKKS